MSRVEERMQDTIDKCLGWTTQYNPLSVAKGALARSENCVSTRENIAESRRGHALYGTLSNAIRKFLIYSSRVLTHNGSALSYDDGSGTFGDYSGSYSAPTGHKMRGVQVNSNLMITTSEGVKVISDVAGTAARRAGVPRMLGPAYTLTSVSSGFLSNASQVSYRVVLERTDANGNVISGYPSERLWVPNASGNAENVNLTVYLPSEAASGDVIKVYRTSVDSTSATDDTAGDEMGLVYRQELDSTDISNGYHTFTDSTIDALRGETLYTSPSQQGIGQANERPPLCKDMALFKSEFMVYANTVTKHRLFFSLLTTSNLSTNSIKIAGVTYNFDSSEIISGAGSPQVKVSSTGVVAVDIAETARSLVKVINLYAGNTTVYAYYVSGTEDLPGQIMIEERGIGGSAFTISAIDAALQGSFSPELPLDPATSSKCTSSNEVGKNRVYIAKSGQSEAVPILSWLPAGPSNKEILRVAPLRESMIIVKEEGVYRMTGNSASSMTITPLDLTVFCKSKESVVVLANQVIMLSNQGVVSITDSGVQVISRDIENELLPLLTYGNLDTYAEACAYESDRMYLLSTPDTSEDTSNTQTFVYNIFTRRWDHWPFGFDAAIVEDSVDKMFLAKNSDSKVYRERKSFSDTDYCDPEYDITISAISGREITFSVLGVTPLAGWIISQGGTGIHIESVEFFGDDFVATLESDPPETWTTGAAELFPAIDADVLWLPWSGGQVGALKQVRAVQVIDDPVGVNSTSRAIKVYFSSNFSNDEEEVEVENQEVGWGDAWGEFAWGGAGSSGFPTWVPREKQMCSMLHVGVRAFRAQERLAIAALSFTFEGISESGGGR